MGKVRGFPAKILEVLEGGERKDLWSLSGLPPLTLYSHPLQPKQQQSCRPGFQKDSKGALRLYYPNQVIPAWTLTFHHSKDSHNITGGRLESQLPSPTVGPSGALLPDTGLIVSDQSHSKRSQEVLCPAGGRIYHQRMKPFTPSGELSLKLR